LPQSCMRAHLGAISPLYLAGTPRAHHQRLHQRNMIRLAHDQLPPARLPHMHAPSSRKRECAREGPGPPRPPRARAPVPAAAGASAALLPRSLLRVLR
jgi:hypothetical protein